MNLSSNEVHIEAKDEIIFQMLSNCNNFKQYVPEINNWNSTENSCNFSIQGVGDVQMNIIDKKAFSSIVFDVKNSQISSLSISFTIKNNNTSSFLSGHSSIEIPFFIAQMIKPSLQKFLNNIVERIKLAIENKAALPI